jgi:hypothetical protein
MFYNYCDVSVNESHLGLEQCFCPCNTEISVYAAKEDLTDIADIN